jgi:hypothetical protein
MSLPLIIIVNVALDGAVLGAIAWALSRPSRLGPRQPPDDHPPPPAAHARAGRARAP